MNEEWASALRRFLHEHYKKVSRESSDKEWRTYVTRLMVQQAAEKLKGRGDHQVHLITAEALKDVDAARQSQTK